MSFTGNPLGVRKILLVFVGLFALGALGLCHRAKADEPNEGLSIGFGVAGAGTGNLACWGALEITQSFGDEKWLADFATHGQGKCLGEEMGANMMAGIMRTTHLGRWTFGVGAGVLVHGDRTVGPLSIDETDIPRHSDVMQMCANLLVRYQIGERVVLDALHCSTGGTTAYNYGVNFLTVGLRF